jgi:hypothetical protein
MALIRNPRAVPELVLGTDTATFAAARAALVAFFDARNNQEQVDEAQARATHPLFANDRIWNHVKSVLGI